MGVVHYPSEVGSFYRGYKYSHSNFINTVRSCYYLPPCAHSVDSRNFKMWGRSPTTTQNVCGGGGGGLKILGGDFMMKFKLIRNTFSVYLDIFNSGLLLISGKFLLSCPIKINFKASEFICLFGVLRRFQHCTGHITTGSWKGRGNQYIEFARVVYCKLPTNGKQLPAFPLTAMTGIEPRPQRWEARVLPLCHRGPF